MNLWRIFLLSSLLTLATPSWSVVETISFDSQKQEQRYKALIDELRCLVCQNQNLADSDAPLAKDLRSITIKMLKEGKSDKQIKTFMRERYGDFVLYKPPVTPSTYHLWFGPFLLLVLVLFFLVLRLRKKQDAELLKTAQANDEATRIKVQNLLRDTPEIAPKNRD